MFKVWIKIEFEEKIIKNDIFCCPDILSEKNFIELLREACHSFDIPTPVVLQKHLFNYVNFNHLCFVPSDFVENFPYSRLVIENAIV